MRDEHSDAIQKLEEEKAEILKNKDNDIKNEIKKRVDEHSENIKNLEK
jgi:hypothetical protein